MSDQHLNEAELRMMTPLEYTVWQRDEAIEKLEMMRRALTEVTHERDAAKTRCNEAHAALSLAFGALVEISLLTKLGGEVDDYMAVVSAVKELREALEQFEDTNNWTEFYESHEDPRVCWDGEVLEHPREIALRALAP